MTDKKPQIARIVPEGVKGLAQIAHFDVSKAEADFTRMRAAISSDRWAGVDPGRYARLIVDGELMMSDTAMEWMTNNEVLWRANGDVLIAGLGLGLILIPILANSKVKSVTVLEKYQDVVDLVVPHMPKSDKLTVVCADAMEWAPPKATHWDVLYFDIWPQVCTDNLPEMTKLKRRFAKRLRRDNPEAWMGCWREEELRYNDRRERRSERYY